MASEIAALEADIREYKIQVSKRVHTLQPLLIFA
jgi:hypothetical protein